MIKSKFNVIILLIFLSAQAAEDTEKIAKYKNCLYSFLALGATAAIVIPLYIKSRATTLDGINLFEKSTNTAVKNFRHSGNLYTILGIEDKVVPDILLEYEKYPVKNKALLQSFLSFKKYVQDYKIKLNSNNPSLIKSIRAVHCGLPEDVTQLLGKDVENFLLNQEINSKTTKKIQGCERKLLSEINK